MRDGWVVGGEGWVHGREDTFLAIERTLSPITSNSETTSARRNISSWMSRAMGRACDAHRKRSLEDCKSGV